MVAGLAAALGAALIKAETDNVVVARAKAGLSDHVPAAALNPRSSGLSLARRIASALRFHRIIQQWSSPSWSWWPQWWMRSVATWLPPRCSWLPVWRWQRCRPCCTW